MFQQIHTYIRGYLWGRLVAFKSFISHYNSGVTCQRSPFLLKCVCVCVHASSFQLHGRRVGPSTEHLPFETCYTVGLPLPLQLRRHIKVINIATITEHHNQPGNHTLVDSSTTTLKILWFPTTNDCIVFVVCYLCNVYIDLFPKIQLHSPLLVPLKRHTNPSIHPASFHLSVLPSSHWLIHS